MSDITGLVGMVDSTAHGIITDWLGRGEKTHEQLLDIAAIADIPREWLPQHKDAKVHLSRALQYAAGTQYRVRPVRKPTLAQFRDRPEQRNYSDESTARWYTEDYGYTARYSVEILTQGEVRAGEPTGRIALVATLWDARLQWDVAPGSEALRVAAEDHFQRSLATQRYEARDITKWMQDILRRRCNAVRYGRTWYVPRDTKTIALNLISTVRASGWGHSWMYPPVPVATTQELSLGVALGLQQEVADTMADLEVVRATARKAGRADIGKRAAMTFSSEFAEIHRRVEMYRALIGEANFSDTLNVLADATILVDGILDFWESHADEDE